ncbi:MAG TPA: hypothetical protein VM580_35080 [Labilithrix sp.]|jgi:hypothetical protein|nr:hypothetical protein [Labilithrix sp.]
MGNATRTLTVAREALRGKPAAPFWQDFEKDASEGRLLDEAQRNITREGDRTARGTPEGC